MKWVKLPDFESEDLFAGTVLRVPTVRQSGDWYRDSVVDFLIFDAFSFGKGCGLGLIVMSGYKAGKVNVIFPDSSSSKGKRALNKTWLMDNWKRYFYPDGLPEQAWVTELESINSLPDGTIWEIPEADDSAPLGD